MVVCCFYFTTLFAISKIKLSSATSGSLESYQNEVALNISTVSRRTVEDGEVAKVRNLFDLWWVEWTTVDDVEVLL